jgi:hypothetical protein
MSAIRALLAGLTSAVPGPGREGDERSWTTLPDSDRGGGGGGGVAEQGRAGRRRIEVSVHDIT